jgi:HEAT repeat protein
MRRFIFALCLSTTAVAWGDADLVRRLLSENNETRRMAREAASSLSDAEKRGLATTLSKSVGGTDPESRTRAAEALALLGPAASPAIPALRRALADDSPHLQLRAAEALAAIGEEAVPAFRAALKNENPEVRSVAAAALGREKGAAEPAIGDLIALLRDPDPRPRAAAAQALGQLGPTALSALTQNLASATGTALLLSIQALGAHGPDARDAVPALLEKLDGPRTVRLAVIKSVGRIGASAVSTVTSALQDPMPAVRSGAADILADLGRASAPAVPALTTALDDAEASVRSAAAFALGKTGAAGAPALTKLRAMNADSDAEVRQKAAEAARLIASSADLAKAPERPGLVVKDSPQTPAPLTKRAPAAKAQPKTPAKAPKPAPVTVESLEKELLGSDVVKRQRAAKSLIERGDASVPVFTRGLQAADAEVRKLSAESLGQLGAAALPAVEALQTAWSNAEPAVSSAAAFAIVQIDSGTASTYFAGRLREANADVRLRAARVINVFGAAGEQSVPALAEAAKDDQAEVRDHALAALKRIGTPAAQKALEDASRREEGAVVDRLIAEIGRDGQQMNKDAVAQLSAMGAPAQPALTRALKDPNKIIRAGVATALGRLGAAAQPAIPSLLECLDEPEATVRAACAEALDALDANDAGFALKIFRVKEFFRSILAWLKNLF